MSFRLRRVGFNGIMYKAMMTLQEPVPVALPTNSQPAASRKRPGNTADATSNVKKTKLVDRRGRSWYRLSITMSHASTSLVPRFYNGDVE